jgi:hypothetical protein
MVRSSRTNPLSEQIIAVINLSEGASRRKCGCTPNGSCHAPKCNSACTPAAIIRRPLCCTSHIKPFGGGTLATPNQAPRPPAPRPHRGREEARGNRWGLAGTSRSPHRHSAGTAASLAGPVPPLPLPRPPGGLDSRYIRGPRTSPRRPLQRRQAPAARVALHLLHLLHLCFVYQHFNTCNVCNTSRGVGSAPRHRRSPRQCNHGRPHHQFGQVWT